MGLHPSVSSWALIQSYSSLAASADVHFSSCVFQCRCPQAEPVVWHGPLVREFELDDAEAYVQGREVSSRPGAVRVPSNPTTKELCEKLEGGLAVCYVSQ